MAYKKPECKFKKSPQGLDDNKSKGQIELSIKKNLIETLRSNLEDVGLVSRVVDGVKKEVEEGKLKNAIELLKIAKEPDKQEVKLDSSEIIAPVINVLPVKGNNEL